MASRRWLPLLCPILCRIRSDLASAYTLYTRASKETGIERREYARVKSVDADKNLLTVVRAECPELTYDLDGSRAYLVGGRMQFTAGEKKLKVSNRDLATMVKLEDGKMTVELDGKTKRKITFDTEKFRQFDHGYAATSHSS